jgi:pimeloyl-ACP methyl ester carboxylesterase
MIPDILIVLFSVSAFYAVVSYLIANGFAMSNRVPVSVTPDVAYENISFRSHPDNVLLKGWYIPAASNKTVIVMHGGKQNRCQQGIGLMDLCLALNKQGYSILTFDRRGCGQSESSKPGARSCLDRDFAGAIKFLRDKKGSRENVYLWGTSIGAVAALSCAAKMDSVRAIVADSCFADIPEMVDRVMKKAFPAFVVFKPGSIYMGQRFMGMEKISPVDNASRISCPVLFINGTQDPIIPEEDTYRLFHSSPSPASRIWMVAGAEHSKSFLTSRKEYISRITSFLK